MINMRLVEGVFLVILSLHHIQYHSLSTVGRLLVASYSRELILYVLLQFAYVYVCFCLFVFSSSMSLDIK